MNHFGRQLLLLAANSDLTPHRDRSAWEYFGWHMLLLWAFGLSGIALLYIGFWVFDRLTPGIHFGRELVEKQNTSIAIVIASIFIGIAIIVAATILG